VEAGRDLLAFEADLEVSDPDDRGSASSSLPKVQQLTSGPSRLRGRMRFQGSALAEVGRLVDVQGVGKRFSGDVFVTGVTHQLDDGGWTTDIEFGLPLVGSTGRRDGLAPAPFGRLPGIDGLHLGVVRKLDGDPRREHRVQVSVPSAGLDSVWARLLQVSASNAFGALFAPEIGDEVLLGWFDDDPGDPVVLGSLYSSQHPPPTPLSARNEIKTLVTRCKARLEFNDEDRVITLLTPGGNKMVFSDQDKTIVITDQSRNKVELGPGGITLDSPKDIRIRAKGAITLDAVGAVSLSSKADVDVDGLNVTCTAKAGMVAKGSATAELSASGQTTVKGAVVRIN
jgi:phage baseplate assembly protein gpV